MNETTYTGKKAEVSRINVALCDGKPYGATVIEGDAACILAMASGVIHATLEESPKNRWNFLKVAIKILHDTRPSWINRLMFDICGVGVIFAGVYGFAALMHWLEVTLL